ncbi:MAG: SMP-30/gluconolactonase/LRE family protein [Kineosporiaceae bacterium]
MAPRTLRAQQVSDVVCEGLGEGPVWDPATGVVHLVDLEDGGLLTARLRADPGAELPALDVTRRDLGGVVACVRPRASGGLAVATERGFTLLDAPEDPADPAGGSARALPDLWDNPGPRQGWRFNDGGCDTRGRFWCGAMAWDAADGQGRMWRLDPDGSAVRVDSPVFADLSVSNGLSFTADGTRAYFADSATGRLDVLDLDADGEVTGRRVHARLPADIPVGDGLTLDADGGVWVAVWNGGAVLRYDPAGRLDAVVEFPVTYVTCPAFVGPDLDVLVVTTSQRDLAPGEEPGAGAVFAVRPGVRGVPVLPFGG